MVTSKRLLDDVDDAWAYGLGCTIDVLRAPGTHLVVGGPQFQGYDAIYMVRIDDTLLVYCPEPLRGAALEVLGCTPHDQAFTESTCKRIAGKRLLDVRGPAWHGFTDEEHFVAAMGAPVERLSLRDVRLGELRRACGEEEWAEAGFLFDEGVLYGVDMNEQLVAAGNLTPFREHLADVALITRPDHRGRGLAKSVASHMTRDALAVTGLVRYRTTLTNRASQAVARSLGFVGRGENLVARLGER